MTLHATPPTAAAPDIDRHGVFESLFEACPDGLLLVDGGGVIVLANPAAEGLLLYAPVG